MPITRTTMIDDDGSGTTGTILNNAWLQTIYNQIDAHPSTVTNYVPAWTSTGVAPAIGNGTIDGLYIPFGRVILFSLSLAMGSTTTFGSGAWLFALPPFAGGVNPMYVLTAEIFNSATGSIPAVGTIFSGSTFAIFAAGAVNGIGPTLPFTWKASDRIRVHGWIVI